MPLLSACTTEPVLTGQDISTAPVRVWFVQPAGSKLNLVAVDRTHFRGCDRLEEAVSELLAGPSSKERDSENLGSEIPAGTILLGVNRGERNVELDLSARFASGGGSTSMSMRLEQLTRTVAEAAGSDKVYLLVEGKRLEATSGEGLEVKQPLN